MAAQPWDRLPDESGKAYAAFLIYMRLPVGERTVDTTWRKVRDRRVTGDRAPGHFARWATKYNWLARATAHDAHLAQLEQEAYDARWLERKKRARERDWEQADKLREIIDEALPHAERFIRSQRTFIKGEGGAPDREVITLSFDVTGLTTVLEKASKLQRLANDEPTEHVELSGAALDAAIASFLAKLAHPGQKAIAGPVATDGDSADQQ